MGSNSSAANFPLATCQCDVPNNSHIQRVDIRHVPLSLGTDLAFTGLKIISFTIGIIPTAIAHATGNGYRDNNHACCQTTHACNSCGLVSYRTIHMDSNGKHFHRNVYGGDGYIRGFNVAPGALTFGQVRTVFANSHATYPTWSAHYNCGHYANDIYRDLYNA